MALKSVGLTLAEGVLPVFVARSPAAPLARRVSSSDWRRLIWSAAGPSGVSTRAVLAAVAERMSRDGSGAYQSQRTLAVMAGVSLPTVCLALRRAEQAGWLLVFRSGRDDRGWLGRNHYVAAVPSCVSTSATGASDPVQVACTGTSANGAGAPVQIGVADQLKPLVHIPSDIPLKHPLGGPSPSAGSLAPPGADSPARSASGSGAGRRGRREAPRLSFAADFRRRFGSDPECSA